MFRDPSFLRRIAVMASLLALPFVHAADTNPTQERADRFLRLTNSTYQALSKIAGNAQWDALTDVSPLHDAVAETAGKAYAAFNGNPDLINEAKALLLHRSELNALTIRELEQLLLNAAEGPMTNPQLVNERIAAEVAQNSTLNGF